MAKTTVGKDNGPGHQRPRSAAASTHLIFDRDVMGPLAC